MAAPGLAQVGSDPISEKAVGRNSELSTIVVTATRHAESILEVPAAIDVVRPDSVRPDALGVNLSEVLDRVPGLLVRNRQNSAQDEQVSIRGFGARATFGVRGIRLYTDGIPASMPDGSGQVSHFNLDSAERIEVLRGPYSALYGNSSGGVIQLFTADGIDPAERRFDLVGGSSGNLRSSVNLRDASDRFDSNIGLTWFRTDGYRDHSAAQRLSSNAKLHWQAADDATLTLLANTLSMPEAQDPLGLDREQFDENPRQATEAATLFNTRKSVNQVQAGAIWEQDLGDQHDWRALVYGGKREVEQFLAIPVFAQLAPRSAGGVIDLDGSYRGGDVRWSWRGSAVEFTLGTSYEAFDQQRRGYENFLTDLVGVKGALRRDEGNRSRSLDQYAQMDWEFAPSWSLLAGIRHSNVAFRVDDHYITQSNPDDSGERTYSATTPVAGLLYRPSQAARLYASWGRGFETPTFSEISYRNDGGGLNLDLKPARTQSVEVGAKFQWLPNLEFSVATFRAETNDEIAVATNFGGRSTYRNVAQARRQGIEASLRVRFDDQWRLQLAATGLDARFRTPFLACVGIPCVVPSEPVAAGARIPGIPRLNLGAQIVRGGDLGWRIDARINHLGDVLVNDAGTQSADAYSVFGLGIGYGLAVSSGRLRSFLELDNLFDRRYAGSVIVNDGNGRFYEPAAGRSVTLGVQWLWSPR